MTKALGLNSRWQCITRFIAKGRSHVAMTTQRDQRQPGRPDGTLRKHCTEVLLSY